MPAVRRSLGRRRHGRAVAGPDPDAPARRRASGRSATSSTSATTSCSSSASRSTRSTRPRSRRAAAIVVRLAEAGERLETLDHVERELEPETLLIADPAGPARASPASWAARRPRSATCTTDVDRRVGDLRPGQHPPDGVPLRPPLRGEPALREGPGAPPGAPRAPIGRRGSIAEWAGGRVARGVVDTNPSEPPAARSRSAPLGSTGCSARSSPPDEQRDCWPGSASTTAPAPTGDADRRRQRAAAARSSTRRRRDARRPSSRRGGATSRSRRTSPRRSPASAATRSIPADPAGHADAAVPALPLEVRDARPRDARRGRADRGRHLRPRLAGDGRTIPRDRGRPSCTGRVRRRPPDHGDQPALAASTRSCARASLGSLLEVVSTNLRHGRDDIAIFEIGKGYGARDDGAATHEWWRLGVRPDRRRGAAGLEPARAAVRPRRRQGRDRAARAPARPAGAGLRAGSRRPAAPSRSCRPGRRAGDGGSPAASASSIPAPRRGSELRDRRVLVAELAIAGLSAGPAGRVAGATPSRQPVVERDLAVIVAMDVPAADVEAADPAPTAGPLLAIVAPVRHLSRRVRSRTGEKSLAYRAGVPGAAIER